MNSNNNNTTMTSLNNIEKVETDGVDIIRLTSRHSFFTSKLHLKFERLDMENKVDKMDKLYERLSKEYRHYLIFHIQMTTSVFGMWKWTRHCISKGRFTPEYTRWYITQHKISLNPYGFEKGN